ncbi:MAG: MgtC/SapB family protein [Cytophagales bacterium]|nr:MgtC/SapB family protein [Cytophagales bacterium]
MVSELFTNLILALVFGATIGLERESHRQGEASVGDVGGIRTFSMIALLGAVTGIFFLHSYTALALILVAGFLVLLISSYVVEGAFNRAFGITSELSAVATFFLGVLVVIDIIPLQTTVAIFVALVFILSLKSQTTKLVAGISKHEIQSFISYAIITLVALPVLPDYAYKLKDIPLLHEVLQGFNVDLGEFDNLDLINPRKIWLVVVLITGIDVFGYVLGRIVGTKNGFALTSFMAGFVSSTSTTQSLAQRSKKSKSINHLVGAAVLANLASFLQIFLLVGPLNPGWLIYIAPSVLIMILVSGLVSMAFFRKKEPKTEDDTEENKVTNIFSLMPALKFAGLLIVIKIVTKICLILFGQSGFIISSVIASFAGIDAILVNLADMAGHTITFKFAFITFLAINATNLLSKSVYSYLQGDARFAIRFLASVFAMILASAVWLIFV